MSSPLAKKMKHTTTTDLSSRWTDINTILRRSSPFGNQTSELPLGEFDPSSSEETAEFLQSECTVLVIGAGGLGCEILKDLALSGFGDIHVIDMDRIDVTNLNRQFLFRESDVGQPKATVAAKFIESRIPTVQVTPHFAKIQDFDAEFYQKFNIVVSGLDNIEARRWLNSMLVSLVSVDEDGEIDPSTIIPLVDGGTEGFKGQARVILPKLTSCFECSLETFPPQVAFPMCTIAETPRQPEHCIAYAYMILFPKEFPKVKLDCDSPDHMSWVYKAALDRATSYGISGVTYKSTMGVVKNIIPAVPSTNAVISAMIVNEAWKMMSYASRTLNTYHMHMGSNGVYSHTFCYERKADDCPVCAITEVPLSVSSKLTLNELISTVLASPPYRLRRPSITSPTLNLFMQGPPALREATAVNLDKELSSLVADGTVLSVTDPMFVSDVSLALKITFK